VALGLEARFPGARDGRCGCAKASTSAGLYPDQPLPGQFNLIPLPPFDGSHIVEGLLPEKAAALYARVRRLGFVLGAGVAGGDAAWCGL
jgi:hypothetical protein